MPNPDDRLSKDPFIDVLQANTTAILALESRFDLFCQASEQHYEKLKKVDETINGNGKKGMKAQVQKLELYATFLVGLFGTGIVGVIAYIIIRGVELVYTHP